MKEISAILKKTLLSGGQSYTYFPLDHLPGAEPRFWEKLPFSIRVLLEGLLRHAAGGNITLEPLSRLAGWPAQPKDGSSTPFFPTRVVLQDFTGVPVMNDLAALRDEVAARGGDPLKVNPVIPVDLVIDHSVTVDESGHALAAEQNAALEMQRNQERFRFLRWCEQAFDHFRVIPPSSGIIHQVNLEHLAQLLSVQEVQGERQIFAETLIGTDSHTTMINGLGALGWGAGGIEAIAAMMGEPIEISTPEVIGLHLEGCLPAGAAPTDLALAIVQTLRRQGVVDKFIEVIGPGASALSVADRAMIANMAPESGATAVYFPVDRQSLDYLRLTGKPESHVRLVEAYYRAQHLFREDGQPEPDYSQVLELNLDEIEPSLAGPKYPHERVKLSDAQAAFRASLVRSRSEQGFGVPEAELGRRQSLSMGEETFTVGHGFISIAAITSCTNTSNPTVMIAAGLLAKKAVEFGLRVPAFVKTSLAPGSRVVSAYLECCGLLEPLGELGFHITGFGCMTCIGNSGPLAKPVEEAVEKGRIIASAVLSGNRNFEGRIHPLSQANYLASPPLVVAYALAGTVDIDLSRDPVGHTPEGKPVFLSELWPKPEEVQALVDRAVVPELFEHTYAQIAGSNAAWNLIQPASGSRWNWEDGSTYLQKPPFCSSVDEASPSAGFRGGRVLLLLGDSVTTDHISPAGAIPESSPAGRYLLEQGVPAVEFNSYGARRGSHPVMGRGTFANPRLKNLLAKGKEGGWTPHFPDGELMEVFTAAERYQAEGIPLIIIAGKNYGTGSSRDWAAKGPRLLGVQAVLAQSFERIHRSNLAGMGILPLEFLPGESAAGLGLDGTEIFEIEEMLPLYPGKRVRLLAKKEDRQPLQLDAVVRLNSPKEVQVYLDGGIMNTILAGMTTRPEA